MKAYLVWHYGAPEDGEIVHADNRGKAKAGSEILSDCDFVDLRARRIPGLDEKDVTTINILKAELSTWCDFGYCEATIFPGEEETRRIGDRVYCEAHFEEVKEENVRKP